MTIIKFDLNKILYSLLGRCELIEQWWNSTNKAFDNRTPNELYWGTDQERKRVVDYILGQANGDYS